MKVFFLLMSLLTVEVVMSSEGKLVDEIKLSDAGKTVNVLNDTGFKVIGLGFKKGQKLEKHSTAVPAFLFVHQGKIEFSMEGKKYLLEEGSYFKIPVKVEHELLALTEARAFLIK